MSDEGLGNRYRDRVARALPGLLVERTHLVVGAGLGTDALYINEDLIALLSTKVEQVGPQRGAAIARHLRPHLSVDVPEAIHEEPGLVVFKRIPGSPLTYPRLLAADAQVRAALADRLGTFLAELHAAPPPADLQAPRHWSPDELSAYYRERIRRFEEELYPQLGAGRELAVAALAPAFGPSDFFAHRTCAIHADLTISHILVDTHLALRGIVDFGSAVYHGDPARDLSLLLICTGADFVRMVAAAAGESANYPRAVFLAHMMRYDWALNAIEGQGTRWFLNAWMVPTPF